MSEYHNGGNAEADEKMGLSALLAQSSPGIAATGVLYGLGVSQTSTASGSVQIAQGAGVVQGSLTAGASLLTNPAPTLNVFTANPVGSLPRNDIVVFDAVTAAVSVIVGTANATPTDPTVPNTALKLKRLRHPANATTIPDANMDDLRVYTSLMEPAGSTRIGMEAAYQSSPVQSVAASTVWAMRWNPPSENVGGFGVPNGFSFTVPTTGLYTVTCGVNTGTNQGSRAYIDLYLGLSRLALRDVFTTDNRGFVSGTARLVAGDTIKVEVYATTATSITGGWLSAYRISA